MEDELRTKDTIKVTQKGTAYAQKEGERHAYADYIVESDSIDNKGNRVLVLTPRDLSEADAKRGELVRTILKALGEGRSKVLKKLLDDVFIDWHPEALDTIYEKVVLKGGKVKTEEGCFRLLIGDQRCKDSSEIMLRD